MTVCVHYITPKALVYTAPHSEADHVVDKLFADVFHVQDFQTNSVFRLHVYVFLLVLLRH